MNLPADLSVRVTNWPAFRRSTEFSLDRRLCADEAALAAWCATRYGAGRLLHIENDRWEYRRSMPGPDLLWDALAFILNKSYQ